MAVHQKTSKAIAGALELARRSPGDHTAAIRKLGEGWVGEEALAIALYAGWSGKDYVEVIRIAANHDGDRLVTARRPLQDSYGEHGRELRGFHTNGYLTWTCWCRHSIWTGEHL